ncbi:MAG: leukotriene A4 hydrolase C-terminal domain-containing protein, partial [Bacteroidales bacterium]|nr:leukotriene A4 hydrolase C-terminal domain-containing protein [Bacteroidales bacterium]
WFLHVINNQYSRQYDLVEDFLCSVGRRKFLMPLYTAMIKTDEGKKLALNIYKKARPGYHYVSYSSLDGLLGIR